MATATKYALLSGSTCVAIVLWDGVTPYDPAPYTLAPYNPAVHIVTPDPRLVNKATLIDKITQAITANITFIAIASPTTAQVATQAKAQAKQWNALAKIALDLLDDTTGT